jgi:cation-transporting P-type ATPase E
MRVLLFAWHPELTQLQSREGEAQVPHGLIPLGAVSLRDTLRPEARETLARLADVGVQIKVISGDHPQTVAALARQVGLAADIQTISGEELETLDAAQLAQVAQEVTIFGRITPQQKERLVQALRSRGHFDFLIICGAVVLWGVLLLTIWHFHLFERFLQMEWKDISNQAT